MLKIIIRFFLYRHFYISLTFLDSLGFRRYFTLRGECLFYSMPYDHAIKTLHRDNKHGMLSGTSPVIVFYYKRRFLSMQQ